MMRVRRGQRWARRRGQAERVEDARGQQEVPAELGERLVLPEQPPEDAGREGAPGDGVGDGGEDRDELAQGRGPVLGVAGDAGQGAQGHLGDDGRVVRAVEVQGGPHGGHEAGGEEVRGEAQLSPGQGLGLAARAEGDDVGGRVPGSGQHPVEDAHQPARVGAVEDVGRGRAEVLVDGVERQGPVLVGVLAVEEEVAVVPQRREARRVVVHVVEHDALARQAALRHDEGLQVVPRRVEARLARRPRPVAAARAARPAVLLEEPAVLLVRMCQLVFEELLPWYRLGICPT
mmetsp:Transcript_99865/g.282647  ORF Transcript_99865/g.282647 Transcript_99865/m.282647 type:complete len:289 (+) Transcript_99865:672-1538(+)